MRISYRVCDICGQKLTDGCVIDVRFRTVKDGKNAQSQRCIDMCDGCFNEIKNRIDAVADALRGGGRRREVSASIRIKIIVGTSIEDAYYDCEKVSIALGGISVETDFNGVEMFYCHQPVKEWIEEYRTEHFGKAKSATSADRN